MPNPFKALAKIVAKPQVYWPILILLGAVVVAVVGYLVLGRWLDAIIIALALAIILMMVVVLKVFFTMEKDERLGRGLESPVAAGRPQEAETVELAFQRAVDEIRTSRLGAGGIEALPWLLMLGEAGEGKTAAVRESGLELPAEYATRVSGGPTASCDWWLTNDAIVLDLAGRYLKCDDEGTEDEWARLLRLLRKHRPGVALNGVIFALSIDSLLSKTRAELDDVARSLRRRVNEATDELGVDLPIYVLVTKLDHLEGFVECVRASPVFNPVQAMGWTNHRRVLADPEERTREGLSPMVERLERILPELLRRDPEITHRRRIFAFPAELDQAIRAVAAFIGRTFAATPYDAPPFLRGVYFTSARREGSTVSPQLHRLGHDAARNLVDESLSPGGLRLRDPFHEIMIGDRDLALPIDRFGRQMRLALNLAAGLVFGVFALWWLVSFGSNLMGIRRLEHETRAVVDGSSSLAALDSMRAVIAEENADLRLLRRGGLAGPMRTALDHARASFAWAFDREFEVLAKRKLLSVVSKFDSGAFEALAQLATDVTYLSDRSSLCEGDTTSVAPELADYAPISANQSDVEAFRRGYEAFVCWASHGAIQTRIDQERESVAGAAARLLELKRLEAWAESSRSYPSIRYGDYGLPGGEDARTVVSGAYTRRAWEGLVVRLLEAIDSTGSASAKAKTFRDTYLTRFDDQWRQFLLDAPTPINLHADAQSSPYLGFIEQLYVNTLADLPRRETPPSWILALREARRDQPLPEEKPPAKEGDEKAKPPPAPPWTAYKAALVPVAADAEMAMSDGQTALEQATKMAQRGGTNFEKAQRQVASMVPSSGDPEAAAKLEEILSMPILDSASAVITRAFEELEQQWRSQVAEPAQGRASSGKLMALYGPGGAVEKLRSGPLAPFYRSGRATQVIGNRSMPFGMRFLRWLQGAQRLESMYAGGSMGSDGKLVVRLAGKPGSVKSGLGPSAKVEKREIRMRCDDGVQKYEYTSGTMKGTLRWSPDCDELFLRVFVLEDGQRRELTPVKQWKGPMALPEFLQAAERSGNELEWLVRYDEAGVTVMMKYELSSGDELVSMRHEAPPSSMGR